MRLTPFRFLRIILLLAILAVVAFYTKAQRLSSTAWLEPLDVIIYPINSDGSESVQRYIDLLENGDFVAIDRFTANQSKRYSVLTRQPTRTAIGPQVNVLPPVAPEPEDGLLMNIWWSLKFRYWAWQNSPDDDSNRHRVRIFTLYHQPEPGKKLKHSYGLAKGLIGLVHAFGSEKQSGQNNIVIAHELLHTVGATDKYGQNGKPLYPHGYADPEGNPFPQYKCEIMAGRIPVSESRSIMPDNLRKCVIGRMTAREINWLSSE